MIKILLADAQGMLREGLHALIARELDMEVVAETADGETAVELARQHHPDVVVLDLHLPGLNGAETTRQVVADPALDAKIIVLAQMPAPNVVTEMLSAGASGYLLKESTFDVLAQCIRAVVKGQYFLGPGLDDRVIDHYLDEAAQRSPAGVTLAAREREVLRLLAEGQATKEIAAQLNLSVKTIETYRRRIMEKTKIFTVAGLTKYAIMQGLTSPYP